MTALEHNHSKGILTKKRIGIPYLQKLKIYEMVDNGMRPRKIHRKIISE
jgi:hypothetical protein